MSKKIGRFVDDSHIGVMMWEVPVNFVEVVSDFC
jgi:hypothetical protein